MYQAGLIDSREQLDRAFSWLRDNSAKGYSGHCWGYNFPWQNKSRLLEANTPTVVNTSYIGHALLDYHEATGEQEALELARSSCDFILKDLNIIETPGGICFSYTPLEKNQVHNASVLGASLLARVYTHTREKELVEQATRAFDFTLNRQQVNGLWEYSINPETKEPRTQTDWHQGFIIDSLLWYIESVKPEDGRYLEAVRKGAEFYKTQFTPEGMGYWRYPRFWPVNIHNQAQGIISFTRLEEYVKGSREQAERIALWTIRNLQSPEGYFYYQKHRLITNRIPYMRWAQSWMFLALSSFMRAGKAGEESA